ncbi:MAG TPA: VOC family protein [Puia sp.]|nr:VOC family protein [Puia sp.]
MKKVTRFLFTLLFISKSITAFSQSHNSAIVPVFNHTTIYVVDLDKSAAFYEKVIGIIKISEPFKDGKHSWFKIGPHCQLHIVKGAAQITPHDINIHLCFSVPSLADYMKHLDKMNISYGDWNSRNKKPQNRPDGVHQIYFQDPDGYWIEVNDDKF